MPYYFGFEDSYLMRSVNKVTNHNDHNLILGLQRRTGSIISALDGSRFMIYVPNYDHSLADRQRSEPPYL